jgi:predicted unusual protein kinase regulating ubiquinone biosynthesis (AarF/ABC1/UbiB family)
MSAASIGQVHAAGHPDGAEVVIKVQYPDVGDAISADLQNAVSDAEVCEEGRECCARQVDRGAYAG